MSSEHLKLTQDEVFSRVAAGAKLHDKQEDGHYYFEHPPGNIYAFDIVEQPSAQLVPATRTDGELKIVAKGAALDILRELTGNFNARTTAPNVGYLQYDSAPFDQEAQDRLEYEAYLQRIAMRSIEQSTLASNENVADFQPAEGIAEPTVPPTVVINETTEVAKIPSEELQTIAPLPSEATPEKKSKWKRSYNVLIGAVVLAACVGPTVHSFENGAAAREACEMDSFWQVTDSAYTGCYIENVAISSLGSILRPLP